MFYLIKHIGKWHLKFENGMLTASWKFIIKKFAIFELEILLTPASFSLPRAIRHMELLSPVVKAWCFTQTRWQHWFRWWLWCSVFMRFGTRTNQTWDLMVNNPLRNSTELLPGNWFTDDFSHNIQIWWKYICVFQLFSNHITVEFLHMPWQPCFHYMS